MTLDRTQGQVQSVGDLLVGQIVVEGQPDDLAGGLPEAVDLVGHGDLAVAVYDSDGRSAALLKRFLIAA